MKEVLSSRILQKKIILGLLAASCIIALLLLSVYPGTPRTSDNPLAQADSLIRHELSLFNIPESRIQSRQYQVNDFFIRKHYVADLPVQVSKTHVHSELNRVLRPLNIRIFGRFDVPANRLTLQFIYRNKIIGTLELRTDPEFHRVPHPAEILVYFDYNPGKRQFEKIQNLGIPVRIVLRSGNRRTLNRWIARLPDELEKIWIWFDDGSSGYRPTDFDDPGLAETIETLIRLNYQPGLLVFGPKPTESANQNHAYTSGPVISSRNIPLADAAGMMVIQSGDRFEFDRQMIQFSYLARNAGQPIALIRGSDQTLEWLQEWIPRIQRGGVWFVSG